MRRNIGCALGGLILLSVLCGAVVLLGVLLTSQDEDENPVIEARVEATDTPPAAPTITPTLEAATAIPTSEVAPETSNISGGPTRRPPPVAAAPVVIQVTAPPTTQPLELPTSSATLDSNAAGCQLAVTVAATVYVRAYPDLTAGEQTYISPDQTYTPIAVAIEDDGTWYMIDAGWVHGSVVDAYGTTCSGLADASRVVWRSMGHVDFLSSGRYREVTNIRVETYMQRYRSLIFDNNTIWYNPAFQ
jgi:hypothetical protein